jgi:hypothetical protein
LEEVIRDENLKGVCIGLAAEFAVASELLRRGIYAQITFGNRKRTDILVMNEQEVFTRIEVKSKRGNEWPNCKGIYGDRVYLVFVDFAKREVNERPDFYILNTEDWLKAVKKRIKQLKALAPEKKRYKNITIDKRNVPVWHNEINKYGQP